jgi:OFA family oxalate/formate antiporter-like MFS transporter
MSNITATGDMTVASSGLVIPTRYRVLIGALLVQLILGTVYGYSIFWQPLESELGLNQEQATYAFSICILSFAAVMVIAGRVQDLMGPRFPTIVGACLMGAGFILASFMSQPFVLYLAHAAFVGVVAIVLLLLFHALMGKIDPESNPIVRYVPFGIVAAVITAGVVFGNQYVGQLGEFDQLFLLWGTVGFLAGAGIGFAYVCPIAALVKWFPNHKGLMAGIAVAGFGFGAFIFAHKDLPFSAENYIRDYGITNLFLVHGVVAFVAMVVGGMMLRNPSSTVAAAPSATARPIADSSWQQALRRPGFWVLWLMFFSGAMAGLMVIGILKPFAGSQLVEAATAAGETLTKARRSELLATGANAVGWLAIFNAVGRIVWGLASDRIGRTPAFVAMFLLQAVMLAVLGALNTEIGLAVGASIIGFNYGGLFALFPSATADLFGSKNLGAIYGWVFTSYGIAGVVGIAAWNAAKEHASPTAALYIAAALCVLSAVLAVGLGLAHKRASA